MLKRIERLLFSAIINTCMHMRRCCHSIRNGGNAGPVPVHEGGVMGVACSIDNRACRDVLSLRNTRAKPTSAHCADGRETITKQWQSLRGIFWLSYKRAQETGMNFVCNLYCLSTDCWVNHTLLFKSPPQLLHLLSLQDTLDFLRTRSSGGLWTVFSAKCSGE